MFEDLTEEVETVESKNFVKPCSENDCGMIKNIKWEILSNDVPGQINKKLKLHVKDINKNMKNLIITWCSACKHFEGFDLKGDMVK